MPGHYTVHRRADPRLGLHEGSVRTESSGSLVDLAAEPDGDNADIFGFGIRSE